MPVKAVKEWIDAYQPGIEAHYKKLMDGGQDEIEKSFWAKWVNDNGTGLEAAPPFQSKAQNTDQNFKLKFPQKSLPPQIAKLMADAWKLWIMAASWAPSPPVPPFSAIFAVTTSSLGVSIAYMSLLSGLMAELAIIPPDPNSAFKLKAVKFGTLFYQATIAAGVQIDGLSLSVPPAPLSIPMLPTL